MQPAPLWRRLAAGLYDLLLILALCMIGAFAVLPFTGGEAVPAGTRWFQAYLAALIATYYLWCWVRGGQTLGMRTWRLRLVADAGALSWPRALLRLVVALIGMAVLGLGLWWALWEPRRRMWHDLAAGTSVQHQP
jgi:uncharacterized RDD family membrane protein YckC